VVIEAVKHCSKFTECDFQIGEQFTKLS